MIKTEWLGLVSMAVAQELQQQKLNLKSQDHLYILGCEHEPVLSVGRSLWKSYNKDGELRRTVHPDLDIYLVSRGGKLTVHNPGQLVIYPILNIRNLGLGIKAYLKILLQTTQQTFEAFGLKVDMDFEKNHGLYINSKKIVSVGLSYSQGWVSQGLSINLNNDLTPFKSIEVCGMSCMTMTSAQTEGLSVSSQDFFKKWMASFSINLKDDRRF